MRLIPESVRALEQLAGTSTDADAVMTAVRAAAEAVVDVVPHCVGMSITLVDGGRSVTLMATSTGVATLDAAQFLDGGPCEDCLATGSDLTVDDLMSEERWARFAQAAAAHGVRSSLSLPLRSEGEVVGGVNLYADTADAFTDRQREVAEIFGAAVQEAVSNADLSMSTRGRAERAPDELRDRAAVDQAVGVLVAQRGVSVAEAQSLIVDAASRAGISDTQAAAVVLQLRSSRPV
jgi:GAF domain-containing protein